MKRLSSRITMVIILCNIAISILVAGILIVSSDKYIKEISYDRMDYFAGQYVNEFNQFIETMENSLVLFESSSFALFDLEKAKVDKGYLKNFNDTVLDPIVKKSVGKTKDSLNLYFFFTPDIADGVLSTWYYNDGSGQYAKGDITEYWGAEDFRDLREDMPWYSRSIKENRNVWIDPYPDDALKIDVISYTSPIYVGETLVGVAGIDATFDNIKEKIKNMKLYDSGYSFLLNDSHEVIVHPYMDPKEEYQQLEAPLVQQITDSMGRKTEMTGLLKTVENGSEYISYYSHLKNGFVLVTKTPEKEILKEMYNIRVAVAFVILTGMLFTSLLAVYLNTTTKNIFNTMKDGLLILGRRGVVVETNKTLIEMLSLGEKDMLGKKFADIFGKEDPVIQTVCESIKKGEEINNYIIQRNAEHGNNLYMMLSGSAMRQLNNTFGIYVCIVSDVTEIRNAHEQAEQANRAKSVFLTNMSHELRSPMNAILGYTQLMQKHPLIVSNSELKEQVQIINYSGEHLLTLINDVLDLSKIEAGRVRLTFQAFDIVGLLHDVERMFRLRINESGLWFNVEVSDALPRYVVGDLHKLRQILINLLTNSMKFTKMGGITLAADCRPSDVQGTYRIKIEVSDTGFGIEENELVKLFEHFEQTESGRKTGMGSGLGLVISREYARLMGGDIFVESKLHHGSKFTLDITLDEGDEKDVENTDSYRKIIGLEEGERPRRILVVDDIPEGCALVSKFLESIGLEVKQASNGYEALSKFKEWHPELIWMDIRMPQMDGCETTKQIRSMEGGDKVKIIALTASVWEDERDQIIDAGCDDYMRKPFREEALYAMMEKHLGLKYRYVETTNNLTDSVASEKEIRERVRNLPEALRKEMIDVVVGLDTEAILETIEKIGDVDEALRNVLIKMANELDYEGLLSMVE